MFYNFLCIIFQGKFGQRNTLSQTEYYTEPDKYFAMVFDAANDIGSIRIVSPKMVTVTYTKVCLIFSIVLLL